LVGLALMQRSLPCRIEPYLIKAARCARREGRRLGRPQPWEARPARAGPHARATADHPGSSGTRAVMPMPSSSAAVLPPAWPPCL